MGRSRKNNRNVSQDEKQGDGLLESEVNEARLELDDLLSTQKRSTADLGLSPEKPGSENESDGVIGDIDGGDCDWSSDEEVPQTFRPINAFGARLKSGTSYYRCNITTAVRELKGLPISREHLELLEYTPFCGFIKALLSVDSKFLTRVMKKDDKAIKCVMSRYHKPAGMFIVGGKSFKPTKRDVELAFAVVGGKIVIPLTKGDAPRIRPQWLVRCFKGCERKAKWKLTKKDLLDKLVELCPKQDSTSVSDVVRLLHCYMLACVFAPKQNTSVSQHLASYVEDISNTKSYDWAGYIVKALLSQLNNTTNMKSGGCTMLLLFWICEHVALVKPNTSARLQFPRCLRWNLRDLYLALEKFGLAGPLSGLVNDDKLELTTAEVEYFKANMRRPKPIQATTRPKLNLLSYMRNTRVSGNLQKSGSSKRKIVIRDKRQATKDKLVTDKESAVDFEGQSQVTKCNQSSEHEGKGKAMIGLGLKKRLKLSPRPLRRRGGDLSVSPVVGSPLVVKRKSSFRVAKNRQLIIDSDSGEDTPRRDLGIVDSYATPQTCRRLTTGRDNCDWSNPNTAEFLDELDPDGVPRGGLRVAPFHESDRACRSLFEDDPSQFNNSQVTQLEAENSRLLLALRDRDEQIVEIQSRAVFQCNKHSDELLVFKGLAAKLRIAIAEVKNDCEDVIARVSNECLGLAQECNRLKGIKAKYSSDRQQLTMNVTKLENEKKLLADQMQKVTMDSTQLLNEKQHLVNQVLVLEDKLSETSSAGKAYVIGMEQKFDEMALKFEEQKGRNRSQLNEERAWGILKDKEIDSLGAKLHASEVIVRNLRAKLATANSKVQELKDIPVTDFLDHPDSAAHSECVELLVDASKVITEMGAEIDEADRTIVEQAVYIERMQKGPFSPTSPNAAPVCVSGVIDTVGSVREVGESSVSALVQPRKRNRLTVSPGSITRAIKQRTQFSRRIPKKLGSDWDVVRPIVINDMEEGVEDLPVVPQTVPFPKLDSKLHAVRRLLPEILNLLKEIWCERGPSAEVIHSGPYGLGVVSTERCVGLLNHKSIDDCMVDGWVRTLGVIYHDHPDLASVHIFPARVFGMVNTQPHPVHLKRWVDDEIASALACDMMLFPMNAPACLSSTAASGFHWTLLRYNVGRHEWYFYNSMPQPTGAMADVYQVQATKIVAYVENAMKVVLSVSNPEHVLLSAGSVASVPVIVETCRQEIGSVDCGIVVCNLIELFMNKKPCKRGAYGKLLAGAYRAKMVQWFLDPDSAFD